jgi:hypothetical protein
MRYAGLYNSWIEKVSQENFIQICISGEGEPRYLPGILDNIEVSDSLLVDEAETEGKSGSVKIISGWADCDVKINLILIDIPKFDNVSVTPDITRFDCLREIVSLFKQMKDGKPRVFTVLHPHISAWGAREFVFNSLSSSESRGKRIIALSLGFDEFDSVSGKSQDRQLGVTQAQSAAAPTSQTPAVGDDTRRGLGKLEARFAKL